MAVSNEAEKIAMLYNMGYKLSKFEPKLLNDFIQSNKKHAAIKVMAIARDNQEFMRGIPRKDFTVGYKNGFNNAKALIDRNPKTLDQLIANKNLPEDFRKGLEAAKYHSTVFKTNEEIKNQPKIIRGTYAEKFKSGHNIGYRLGENQGKLIETTLLQQKSWAAFTEGLRAGFEKYKSDVGKAQEKSKDARLFPPDHQLPPHEYNKLENQKQLLVDRNAGTKGVLDAPEKPKEPESKPTLDKSGDDMIVSYMPSWLTDDPVPDEPNEPDLGIEHEKDRDDYPEPEW